MNDDDGNGGGGVRRMAALVDNQIRWNDTLTLGAGTPYQWVELDGWQDLPGLDSGDVPRPSRHGAWGGVDLAESRTVTLSGRIRCRPVEMPAVLAALRTATRVLDSAELRPLTVRVWGEELTVHARPTQRTISMTRTMHAGHAAYTLQWVAPDPRRYGAEHARTVSAPVRPSTGLAYPLAYPLDYGPPVTGGSATLTVGGDTATHPVVTIVGPCDRPRLTNAATGSTLEFALRLTEGESLVVDCDAGTVRLGGGADRLYTLTPSSAPPELWTLVPGPNPVQFRPMTAAAPSAARLVWSDAHL